jgi:hypothetical protein
MSIQPLNPPPPRMAAPISKEHEHEEFTQVWSGWFRSIWKTVNGNLQAGFTGSIVTAKRTAGGTEGSMTFQNGILVSEVSAT